MIRIYPFIFILLWSSAFITTKPIVDNSDPFSALAFRFFLVAIGFYFLPKYKNLHFPEFVFEYFFDLRRFLEYFQ